MKELNDFVNSTEGQSSPKLTTLLIAMNAKQIKAPAKKVKKGAKA